MRTTPATFSPALAAIALLALLAAPPARAQSSVDLHGWVGTQYRYRATDDDRDQDLYQYLSLELNDDRAPLSGQLFGRLTADLDGNQDREEFYPLASVYDTRDNSVAGHLYHAFLDLNRVPGMKKVRLGRMAFSDAPAFLYFDGALVETNEWAAARSLSAGAYAGWPVHLYETDGDEDAVYGAWVQARPWRGARLRADFAHVEDDNLYGDQQDDFVALSAWQSFGQFARLHASYSRLEDESRDLRLDAAYFNPRMDLMVMASYYQLLEDQTVGVIDFDPFYAAAFTYHPYWQGRVIAAKGLGQHFFVEGGLDRRALVDEDDRSNFNHGFVRYFGSVGARDFAGLTATLTGEVWDAEDQLEKIETWGADLSYRKDRVRASAGSYYSLYKFDYYLNEEKERVQTYYLRLRYRSTESLSLDAACEYEDGGREDYTTVKLGFRYSF